MSSYNQEQEMAAPGAQQPSASANLIGSVMPEDMNIDTENLKLEEDNQNQANKAPYSQNQKGRIYSNYPQNILVDQYCRRSRYRDHRFNHINRDRQDRRNTERKSKWDNNDNPPESRTYAILLETPKMHMSISQMVGPRMVRPQMVGPHMIRPQLVGSQMGIPQMVVSQIDVPQMGGQPMSKPPIGGPPGYMGNISMMPGVTPIMQYPMTNNVIAPQMEHSMPVMHNINVPHIIPNVMDENMVINQNICEPMFIGCGVLLPPIPGVSTPQRREKPNGCRTIFVGGLPNLNLEMLHEMFNRFGTIANVSSHKPGLYHIRFENPSCVEMSFMLTGYRFKFHEQTENEATTMFVDYALNGDDQKEYDRANQKEKTPPCVELFSPAALRTIGESMKKESEFITATQTLATWMERGECNKLHANVFYSLIQSCNSQVRRLLNEKMELEEEFQNMKNTLKDKFARVIVQFEHVAKVLSAAKLQRVFDNFSKQQRKNIETWLKMTEEVENIKEEFYAIFEDEDVELKLSKNMVSLDQLEALKKENESLSHELDGYKNELHLAKDEAERKFEKFKAHFIAQQALQNSQLSDQPLLMPINIQTPTKSTEDDKAELSGPSVPPSEAKLISILTAFLLVHPLGASLDYVFSYIKSLTPNVTQAKVLKTLQKHKDIFTCVTKGVGAGIEQKWTFQTFDTMKMEN